MQRFANHFWQSEIGTNGRGSPQGKIAATQMKRGWSGSHGMLYRKLKINFKNYQVKSMFWKGAIHFAFSYEYIEGIFLEIDSQRNLYAQILIFL